MMRNQHGFTLVELLIVVLIIGVLLGITLLSPVTGSLHKRLQDQAARLQVRFSQIREKAFLDNAEYGFSINSSGAYQWWVLPLESRKWIMLEDKIFREFQIPIDVTVLLVTDEQGNTISEGVEKKQQKPLVVFYSDKESTPFSLTLIPSQDKSQSVILQTDGRANVEVFRE